MLLKNVWQQKILLVFYHECLLLAQIPQYTSFPKKFRLIIVCNFSWDMEMSHEKYKTMHMHIFFSGGGKWGGGGGKRCIMGFVQVENSLIGYVTLCLSAVSVNGI